MIVGDFNFHLDAINNTDAGRFNDITELFCLKQHVNGSTHKNGHTLDLIITRSEDSFVTDVVVNDPALSDQLAVHCHLKLKKEPMEYREINYRKLGSVDMDSRQDELKTSVIFKNRSNELSVLVDNYENTLQSLLDKYSPVKRRMVTIRPNSPWYNDSITKEKRKRRRLERHWRASRLTIHRELYVKQCKIVNNMIKSAMTDYYSAIITENKSNQKVLFNAVDKLLHRKSDKCHPAISSPDELANRFANFFYDKTANIRNDLSADTLFTKTHFLHRTH